LGNSAPLSFLPTFFSCCKTTELSCSSSIDNSSECTARKQVFRVFPCDPHSSGLSDERRDLSLRPRAPSTEDRGKDGHDQSTNPLLKPTAVIPQTHRVCSCFRPYNVPKADRHRIREMATHLASRSNAGSPMVGTLGKDTLRTLVSARSTAASSRWQYVQNDFTSPSPR